MTGKNAVILGPTQSGKTTFAQRALLAWPGCAVYIDPKPTEALRAELAPRDDALVCHEANYAITHEPAPRVILLRPRAGFSIEREGDALINAVLNWMQTGQIEGEVYVVVDEAHRMGLRKHSLDTKTQELFALGRGLGISSTLISQHPRFVPNDLIANCDWVQVYGVHPTAGSPAPHPLISRWWEKTAEVGEWTADMDEWIKGGRHRSVGTDMSEASLIDENGRVVRTVPLHAAEPSDDEDLEDEGDEDGEEEAEEAAAESGPDAESPAVAPEGAPSDDA